MSHRNLGFSTPAIGDEPLDGSGEIRLRSMQPDWEAIQKDGARASAEHERTKRILNYVAVLLNNNLTDMSEGLNTPNGPHPGIPAGYTYLYQLSTHDMTHTAIVPRVIGDFEIEDENQRPDPFILDSLFGGGPIACRHAYEMDDEEGIHRLRLGKFRDPASESAPRQDPPRDLPRCAFAANEPPEKNALLTEVLIADPRNDDNNLLAQMTVLFARVYNVLVAGTADTPMHGGTAPIAARHRAKLARVATIGIYRRILRCDLTHRIMQRDIWTHYHQGGTSILVDRDKAHRVSRAFRFSACRLGHSMVRRRYFLNDPGAQGAGNVDLADLLLSSSLHWVERVPTQRDWMIDWQYFFPPQALEDDARVNWAGRFGPAFSPPMGGRRSVSAPEPGYENGVMMLDLLRGAVNQVPHLSALIAALAQAKEEHGLEFAGLDVILDDAQRRALIAAGLAALEAKTGAGYRIPLENGDRNFLIDNPPLFLFLLFEAQALGNCGETYGPLGSILVGDAFFPVFQPPDATGFGPMERSLEEEVFVREVTDMADLVVRLTKAETQEQITS